jgi:transcriptional regulator with XRE-family HTH domain
LAKGFHDERYRKLIGQLVNRRREQRLTQAALAIRLERHQQFVSRYETGERRLDAVELIDVANALGLDASTLLRDIKPRT